jgi:MFS family permease
MVMVLASMETTITSTAMPTIVGALHGLEHYSWVMSVYLLCSTLTMPVYGWAADLLGRKRVLLFAIALFAIGSLMASFAMSMLQLIVFRGVQGLGAGGIMPVVLTILGDIFTLEERAKIQGAFSAVWGTASLAGPALGAFLVSTSALSGWVPAAFRPFLGWPTIFWVNLPLAVMAAIMLIVKFQDHHHHHAAVNAAGAGGSSETNTSTLESDAGVQGVLTHPVILPCIITSILLGVGVYALDTYVPLYVQGGRGMSAKAAAATVTPVMLAWASSGIFAAPLLLRWGFRKLGVAGSALGTLGFLGLLITALMSGPLWVITMCLFFTGLGFGPASMALLLAAQDASTYRQRGIVTSATTFARNLGGAIGISLLGGLFNLLTAKSLDDLKLPFAESDLLDSRKLGEIQKAHPDLLARAQGTISHGLLWIFVTMLGIAAVQVLVSSKLPAKKRSPSASRVEVLEAAVG